MKLVHSLWTGTTAFRPTRGHLLIHTLAINLALEHFPVVELVTDDRGLAISELLGWEYSSVVNRLDALTRSGLLNVWSLGKMVALLAQDSDFVHADNDVLFFAPLPARARRARLLAERVDNPWHYRSADAHQARLLLELPAGAVAYNCGILGGTDIHLLHKYADEAMQLAERFRGCDLNGTVCAMAFEQYFLGAFARGRGVRVETLLAANPSAKRNDGVKYLHLVGSWKSKPGVIDRAERRLSRDFPEAHRRFCDGWARVERGEDIQLFIVNPYSSK